MNGNHPRWYAVHTRSHFEKKVFDGLRGKYIEAFFPRVQVMSRRRDRRKKIFVPMLPGYVFVRSDLNAMEHIEILKTVGVVGMVGFKGSPVPAHDEEISSLMIMDGTDRTVQNREYIREGEWVRIMEGPLKGVVGLYLKHKDRGEKVVVSIELLKRALSVEIEGWAVEKVG